MTPLSAERVEKLSRIVEGMRVAMPAVNSQEVFNDLLAILSSHEKMRAENEGLREQHKTDEGVNLRLCEMHTNQQKELHNLGKAYKKAEAELELGNKAWEIKQKQLEEARAENLELGAELTSMLNDEIADGFDRNDIEKLQARAEKAEAELAKQAPLPKAVEEAMHRLKLTIDRAYKWRTAQLGYKTGENEKPCDEAALAVIRAALTATIKPPLTVAPTIRVDTERLRMFLQMAHTYIDPDSALPELCDYLCELGIEAQP